MSDLSGQDRIIARTHLYTVLADHPVTKMMRDEAIKNLADSLLDKLDKHGWVAHWVDSPERPPDPVDAVARAAIHNLAGAIMRRAAQAAPQSRTAHMAEAASLIDDMTAVQDLLLEGVET